MGHSSIQITVDTYEIIPGANINWVDGLDRKNLLRNKMQPPRNWMRETR